MKITSTAFNSRVKYSDFAGALTSLPDAYHGMARYGFRDGRAVDFHCFCGQVFTLASQLDAHVLNESARSLE